MTGGQDKNPKYKRSPSCKHTLSDINTTRKPAEISGGHSSGGEARYDPQAKCWRGPVLGKTENLKITKLIREQEKQKQRQSTETVLHDRRQFEDVPDGDIEDDGDDTQSICTNPARLSTKLIEPFGELHKDNINWSQPDTARKLENFSFERPSTNDSTRVLFNTPTHHVQQLNQQLVEKDGIISLLRKQLFKAHGENGKLVNELKQCSGQKYGDVVRENAMLKEQVDRLTRQISRIWGHIQKDNKMILKKIQYEEELEARKAKEFMSNKQK